jgi:eukaryotic-like serine/threonine-protein kinase
MLGEMSESALAEGVLIAGRYRLEKHLGEGGMGSVWAATHTVTRRSVAMKFLKDSVRHRKDLRERFLREAAAASALKHPNVVEIIDVFDFEESSPVLVMERLQGETLGAKLQRDERLSMEETAALLVPVVSAVGAAHELGIVHRDLKPENLFLVQAGATPIVKVLDFGIAKLSAERYVQDGPSAMLTESGSLLGTPCYMAPEQASGDQPVDHRADIWSLGVILYECLSGSRPIEGDSLPQVVARLMSAGIMPLERIAPELPPEVTGLVKRMLSREVGRRTPNLIEVSISLGRYTDVRAPDFGPPSAGRASPAPAAPVVSRPVPTGLREPPVRSKAKVVVASQDANPHGPTMLSSPPVNNSLRLEDTGSRQGRGVYLVGAAVVILAIGGWVWGATRQGPAAAPTADGELPTLPQAPLKAAPTPAPEQATAPVSSAVAQPVASATEPPAKKPAAARSKPRPQPGPAPKPRGDASDGKEFFSGRK